jgi:hypothetical protein
MEKFILDKKNVNTEKKKSIPLGSVILKIKDVFKRYYATVAEKEQYAKGLLPENWKDPDFDIEDKLKSVKGPLIEVAGPSEDGYSMIDTDSLEKKIYTSNLYKGCPIFEDGKVVNYFGKVDFLADVKKTAVSRWKNRSCVLLLPGTSR